MRGRNRTRRRRPRQRVAQDQRPLLEQVHGIVRAIGASAAVEALGQALATLEYPAPGAASRMRRRRWLLAQPLRSWSALWRLLCARQAASTAFKALRRRAALQANPEPERRTRRWREVNRALAAARLPRPRKNARSPVKETVRGRDRGAPGVTVPRFDPEGRAAGGEHRPGVGRHSRPSQPPEVGGHQRGVGGAPIVSRETRPPKGRSRSTWVAQLFTRGGGTGDGRRTPHFSSPRYGFTPHTPCTGTNPPPSSEGGGTGPPERPRAARRAGLVAWWVGQKSIRRRMRWLPGWLSDAQLEWRLGRTLTEFERGRSARSRAAAEAESAARRANGRRRSAPARIHADSEPGIIGWRDGLPVVRKPAPSDRARRDALDSVLRLAGVGHLGRASARGAG